ncbi:MAG TPA: hypothetical protein VK171_11315 [Fimbriimonas sp.]|nr:hypothetical protein [Fimbriimonas sp.]
MVVEFASVDRQQLVSLALPHPASEDPILVSISRPALELVERSVSCIYIEIAEFAQEICGLSDDWAGKLSFSSLEDDFVVLCRSRSEESATLEFILEASEDEGGVVTTAAFEVPIVAIQKIATDVATHVKQC